MKLQINITKEILEQSMYCGVQVFDSVGENCAIALAVRDLFPKAHIGSYSVEILKDGEHKRLAELPKEATDFIRHFDQMLATPYERLKLKPFSFEIEVSDEILELITIDEVREILATSSTLSLIE